MESRVKYNVKKRSKALGKDMKKESRKNGNISRKEKRRKNATRGKIKTQSIRVKI